jgi:branched-subunit amino acid transport protein
MSYWLLIAGMALLTFIPRYIPFALAGRITIPPWLAKALNFVPTAVLTCIIVKATLVHNGELLIALENHYLIAALAALFTSLVSRHLLLTVMVGLVCFGLLQWL